MSVNYDAMAYISIQASWISKHTKSTIWKTVDVVTNLIPSYTNICEKWLSLTKCNFVKKIIKMSDPTICTSSTYIQTSCKAITFNKNKTV